MRGHEKLIAMRRIGKRPEIVFLNDFQCKTDWFETGDRHVTVCVHGDNIQRADMRFLVGLKVSAVSEDPKRAVELFEACKRAGAVVVGAGCPENWKTGYSGWCEVWRKEEEVPHG